MKECFLCKKGKKCSGYILHTVLLKLYDSMEKNNNTDELVKILSRDDILVLANKGAEAKEECWRKSFVLSVAHKFVEIAGAEIVSDDLEYSAEKMIHKMASMFSKLPKGSAINLMELITEIYNQACQKFTDLKDPRGQQQVHVLSKACMMVVQNKR